MWREKESKAEGRGERSGTMMRAEKREEESQCKTSNETREDDY